MAPQVGEFIEVRIGKRLEFARVTRINTDGTFTARLTAAQHDERLVRLPVAGTWRRIDFTSVEGVY